MDVLSVLGIKRPPKIQPQEQLDVFQQLVQGVRDYDKSNQEMKKQVEKLVNTHVPQAVTAKANLGSMLSGLLGYPGQLVAGGGQNMYGGENTGIVDISGQIKRMVTNTSTPQEIAEFQARLPNVAVQAGVAATGGIKAGEGIARRANRVLGGGTVLDDVNALAIRPKPAPVNPLKPPVGEIPKGVGEIETLIKNPSKIDIGSCSGTCVNKPAEYVRSQRNISKRVPKDSPLYKKIASYIDEEFESSFGKDSSQTTFEPYYDINKENIIAYESGVEYFFPISKAIPSAPKGVGGVPKVDGLSKKTFVHETNAPSFDKFDMNKIGTGQGESWLGRGIYLQEKGSFKIEQYGKNKIEASLSPEANIFVVKDIPGSQYRDNFVEYAVKNNIGNARGLAEQRAKEGLSLQNLLPRDILRTNPEAVTQLRKAGFDGLLQDGELVIYNDKVLSINKPLQPPKGVGDPLAKFKKKDNLVKIDPVLEIKKQITARDIQGNKVELPAGEALTPYELKGNKYLLKDGNEYIVNKNQYQNIKGNAVKAEAQPFAPELDQTTETVRGRYVPITKLPNDITIKKNSLGFYEGYGGGVTHVAPTKAEVESEIIDAINRSKKYTIARDNAPRFSQYTLPGGNNYREILIQAPGAGKTDPRTGFTTNADENAFISSHWDEPNVLAHVRLNDRTYKGKPVTFIEEMQSDWAREARKNAGKEIKQINWGNEGATGNIYANTGNRSFGIKPEGNKFYVWEEGGVLGHTVNTLDEAKAEVNKIINGKTNPTYPLLKEWAEKLAVPRILKDAVDSNSEYLAWTTGEQQAVRYDLSKQVDKIDWHPQGKLGIVNIYTKEAGHIELLTKDGKVLEVGGNSASTGPTNTWKGKDVSEVIGKGIGQKIMEKPSGELSEDGLKIGGEWANNLYDRQLPNIIEKLTGQKPEMMDMGLEISATKPIQEFKLNTPNGLSDAITSTKQIKVGDRVYHAGGTYKVNKIVNENTFIGTGMTGIDQPQRTFNVSRPKSPGQMGIKLTPEVKAKVKGEAPPIKQPSGVNPLLMLMGGVGLTGLMADKKRNQGIMQNYLGM